MTHSPAARPADAAPAARAVAVDRPDPGPPALGPPAAGPAGGWRPTLLRLSRGGPPHPTTAGRPDGEGEAGRHIEGPGPVTAGEAAHDEVYPDADADAVALVRRAQAGDRAAFEALVRGTARMLYARLYLETGDRDRADDLVQETYLTAWRSIRQLREVPDAGAFRRWLLAVARTARVDAGRRETRKKRGGPRGGGGLRLSGTSDAHDDLLAGLNDPAPPPDELLDRRERQEQALALLRSLPEEYRLPIAMRYLGGAEYDTICDQLGLTNGSLRGLLSRGMTKLRQLLQASEA